MARNHRVAYPRRMSLPWTSRFEKDITCQKSTFTLSHMNEPLISGQPTSTSINVGYARSANALDQGAMIDVKPLPEEDSNVLVQFKLMRRGTCLFIVLAFLLVLLGIVYPMVANPNTDAAVDNQKKAMNAFIGVGVTILLFAILFFVKTFHSDEIIVTETRYVRKVGTSCDLRFVNFRLASNQRQFNMDYLTGVELRTSTDNSPLYVAVALALLAMFLNFSIPSDKDYYPTVVTIVLVLTVLAFPVYFIGALRGRQAFVRLSFSSGLQSDSQDGAPFEALMSFWKRVIFRYPVYEDSIVLPLEEGGRLYQTMSSLRLRAAARLSKI